MNRCMTVDRQPISNSCSSQLVSDRCANPTSGAPHMHTCAHDWTVAALNKVIDAHNSIGMPLTALLHPSMRMTGVLVDTSCVLAWLLMRHG